MARNGNAARTTPIIDMLATPAVTNKFKPTGGVIIPISIFTTIIIPRWIGSIPSSIAIGKTNGDPQDYVQATFYQLNNEHRDDR